MMSTASTASFVAAAAQGLGDRRVDREAEFTRAVGAEVALGLLVHIERDHLDVRASATRPPYG